MKTLHPELQALLDRMIDHLATQKARAVDPISGVCRYRTRDGLMCAVGCLIDDDDYDDDIEGDLAPMFDPENQDTPWQEVGNRLISLAPSISRHALEQFLSLVQAYHDTKGNADLYSGFIALAATCNYTRAMSEAEPGQLRERIAADLASLIGRCTSQEWFV